MENGSQNRERKSARSKILFSFDAGGDCFGNNKFGTDYPAASGSFTGCFTVYFVMAAFPDHYVSVEPAAESQTIPITRKRHENGANDRPFDLAIFRDFCRR